MDLEERIKKVESRWLEELFQFVQKTFSQVNLPSHDEYHHLRTWNYSKEIIFEKEKHGVNISSDYIQSLMFASFFHDIGMVKTLEETHGNAGKEILSSFLKSNHYSLPNEEEIFDAVKKHDDKTYKNQVYGGDGNENLLSVLCVADDLDAFGYIGVFRYIEIYLLRKVKEDDLANKILSNSESRYGNFCSLHTETTEFTLEHSKRYQNLVKFFVDLKTEYESKPQDVEINSGAIGVLNLLKKHMGKPGFKITDFNQITSEDEYINNFIIELKSELERYDVRPHFQKE